MDNVTNQIDKAFSTELLEDYGNISIRIIVLQKSAEAPTSLTPEDSQTDEPIIDKGKTPVSSYLEDPKRGKKCVVFLVNGQRQHAWDNSFIQSDLEFKYLRNRMIVIVDVDGMKPEAIADLMQGSRNQFYEGKVYEAISSRVIATLKGDPDLIRLEAEAEEEIYELKSGDEVVKRALDKLIEQGKIERPKRSIRFLWIPEISGTREYLRRYPEEVKRIIAAINLDMVGEDVKKNHNSLILYRSIDSRASFLNDICQELFEYVGITNRERVHDRGWTNMLNPIFDPNGSRDPFYYNIERYYGSSDHIVFLDREFGIPAVLFNNWPDMFYHSNEDRPDKADPTQLKRAAFLALASAYVIADAGVDNTQKILALIFGKANVRIMNDLEKDLVFKIKRGDRKAFDRLFEINDSNNCRPSADYCISLNERKRNPYSEVNTNSQEKQS